MNKRIENFIRFLLDECTPPIIRDMKLFMRIPFKIAFGKKDKLFWDFKAEAQTMSLQQMETLYRDIKDVEIQDGATDVSPDVLKMIKKDAAGSVLDAGCGSGILLFELSHNHKTAGCDYVIEETTYGRCPNSDLRECPVEELPWKDLEFNTVIATHVLEHVINPIMVLKELDRVSSDKIIVVLPKERPYKYTFNLHLHFFPYKHVAIQMLNLALPQYKWSVQEIDGSWYCLTNKVNS